MFNVVLWKWRQANFKHTYTAEHVNIMADMVQRHSYDLAPRIICVTDDPAGIDTTKVDVVQLWNDFADLPNRSGQNLPSCYRRLKLFDPLTQESMGIRPGERICSVDLDSVVTNDLRPLWRKHQHFVGWAVRGQHHIRVFNGSMFMFTAGENAHVWSAFNPLRSPDQCHRAGYMGSDQSWLSYNFAKDATAGNWAYPQAVSYPKEVARRPVLSKGISIVFFHGKRKPWHPEVQAETPWISAHWREGGTAVPSRALNVIAAGARTVAQQGA